MKSIFLNNFHLVFGWAYVKDAGKPYLVPVGPTPAFLIHWVRGGRGCKSAGPQVLLGTVGVREPCEDVWQFFFLQALQECN